MQLYRLFMSTMTSKLCDRREINRLAIGRGGATTKGLVERHLALLKLSMLKLKQSCQAEGLDLSFSDICYGCCAGHNVTVNYGGSAPQLALTGQLPRTMAIDSETITSRTGALEKRPD
eukprot:831530-Pyramimonas_sp.AAC.1